MRLNSNENFFLEITIILGQNLFYARESQTIFCPIRNLPENHDLDKRHKIWAKLYYPPNSFLAGTPMAITVFNSLSQPAAVRPHAALDINMTVCTYHK